MKRHLLRRETHTKDWKTLNDQNHTPAFCEGNCQAARTVLEDTLKHVLSTHHNRLMATILESFSKWDCFIGRLCTCRRNCKVLL